MEIGNKIKNLRTNNHLSQEHLAEKIFVTRQTISNWENDKSYPDLNSVIRMSELFNITVDELVKGDITKMKEIIKKDDINHFQKESSIFTGFFILMIISAPLLFYFLDNVGIVIWIIISALGMYYGIKVDKLKKKYDISSFKEIEAFLNGDKLDEIEKKVEKVKVPIRLLLWLQHSY